jgi:oxygen-independent coproporphyrinogen-3 oxidase
MVEEALMMGLRLADGIDRATFASVTGVDPPSKRSTPRGSIP